MQHGNTAPRFVNPNQLSVAPTNAAYGLAGLGLLGVETVNIRGAVGDGGFKEGMKGPLCAHQLEGCTVWPIFHHTHTHTHTHTLDLEVPPPNATYRDRQVWVCKDHFCDFRATRAAASCIGSSRAASMGSWCVGTGGLRAPLRLGILAGNATALAAAATSRACSFTRSSHLRRRCGPSGSTLPFHLTSHMSCAACHSSSSR